MCAAESACLPTASHRLTLRDPSAQGRITTPSIVRDVTGLGDGFDGTEQLPAIDGFVDLIEIGRGGFSVVYSATQLGLNRRVAIKVINASGSEARRFQREATAMGALSDIPHALPALHVTTADDGRPVLVLPLMADSLARLIRRNGACTRAQVALWAAQLAGALDAAHRLGIIHRDIKPENVLISTRGEVFLADFGIATFDSMEASTTTAFSLSPPHAPPERFTGDDASGEMGDIYSLTSTLFTALVGRSPFGTMNDTGGALGLMSRVANEPVPTIAELPDALNMVFARGMAKNPADRYPSAAELATDLRLALADPAEIPAPVSGFTGPEPSEDDHWSTATVRRVAPPDAGRPETGPPPASPTFDDHPPQHDLEPASVVLLQRRRSRTRKLLLSGTLALLLAVVSVILVDTGASKTLPTVTTSIVSSSSHTCALFASGRVKCWGDNSSGQLGIGTSTNSSRPAAVSEVSGAIAITASDADSWGVSDKRWNWRGLMR